MKKENESQKIFDMQQEQLIKYIGIINNYKYGFEKIENVVNKLKNVSEIGTDLDRVRFDLENIIKEIKQ